MSAVSFCTIVLKNRSEKYIEAIAQKFINEAPHLDLLEVFAFDCNEDGGDGFADISVSYDPVWFETIETIDEVDVDADHEYVINLYKEYRRLFDYAKQWSKDNGIKINCIASFCELLNRYEEY